VRHPTDHQQRHPTDHQQAGLVPSSPRRDASTRRTVDASSRTGPTVPRSLVGFKVSTVYLSLLRWLAALAHGASSMAGRHSVRQAPRPAPQLLHRMLANLHTDDAAGSAYRHDRDANLCSQAHRTLCVHWRGSTASPPSCRFSARFPDPNIPLVPGGIGSRFSGKPDPDHHGGPWWDPSDV
jgi:hypothetical protein